MKTWMKSEAATEDVYSTEWGHGKIVSDNSEGCHIVFDQGREALLSFSYYADKGNLFYVREEEKPTILSTYPDGESYGREGTFLYHLTNLENMESILKRGLLSRAQLHYSETGFSDIADSGIISKRGYLERYVPFHFTPETPFDYVVKRDHRDKEFIYICIRREYAKNRKALILPSHPTSNDAVDPLPYEYGMPRLDWSAIVDPYACRDRIRKQHKMAECIVPEPVKAEDFTRIIVHNKETAERIHALYKKLGVSCERTEFVVDGNLV